MSVVRVNITVLKLALVSIRTAAQGIVTTVDTLMEVLEPSTGPSSSSETSAPRPDPDPCKRGEHPPEYIRDARVMADPTKRICRRCSKSFHQKEGAPDGHEAVSE